MHLAEQRLMVGLFGRQSKFNRLKLRLRETLGDALADFKKDRLPLSAQSLKKHEKKLSDSMGDYKRRLESGNSGEHLANYRAVEQQFRAG